MQPGPVDLGLPRIQARIDRGGCSGCTRASADYSRVAKLFEAARSVVTSQSATPVFKGAGEELAVATMSRFLETNTSMTCLNWSIARYRYTHRPAILT
jgi:hypothetical protein